MTQVNSYRLLVLLALLFGLCSVLLFVNIFFESVNHSLEQEINIVSNEKMNLRMSFLHHSSINNLSSTASKLNMVHIDEKNSFHLDTKSATNLRTDDKSLFKSFTDNYSNSKKEFLYGF
ncbi:MAG: hypothetical protein VKK32_04645 [Candidatus Melainabacteria bacterium]|nr:hypothetical protein [Candidatus Melainabacteria bacterium]